MTGRHILSFLSLLHDKPTAYYWHSHSVPNWLLSRTCPKLSCLHQKSWSANPLLCTLLMQPQGDLSNLRPSLHGFLPFCCMIGWINRRSWWIPSILLHVCLSSSVQCWADRSINQNVGWDLDILMAHIPPSSWFLTTLIALYPVLLGRSEKVKLTELWMSEWRRYPHKVSFPMLNWLKYRYRHLSGITAYMPTPFRISFPPHASFTLCCIDRKNWSRLRSWYLGNVGTPPYD